MAKESVVFTVALADRDWEQSMSGWRCAALGIPGATIDALYIKGLQADTGKYKADAELRIVRWVTDPKPDEAMLAIRLTKSLEFTEVGKRWKIFALFVPILVAILTWYLGTLRLAPQWEKWEINGKVDIESPKIPLVTIGLEPPNSRLNYDGSFQLGVPVELENGERRFPRIFFSTVTDDLVQPPPVHLDQLKVQGQQYANIFDYKPAFDYQHKRVTLQELARYRQKTDDALGAKPYDARASQKPKADPPSTAAEKSP